MVNWVICPSDRLCPVSMPLYPPPHGDSLTISHLPLYVEITHDSLSCLTPGSVPADTCWFLASPPSLPSGCMMCLFTKIFVYHMVHSQHQFTECLKCRQDEGAHQWGCDFYKSRGRNNLEYNRFYCTTRLFSYLFAELFLMLLNIPTGLVWIFLKLHACFMYLFFKLHTDLNIN